MIYVRLDSPQRVPKAKCGRSRTLTTAATAAITAVSGCTQETEFRCDGSEQSRQLQHDGG